MGDVKMSFLLYGEDRTATRTLRNLGTEAGVTGSRLEGLGSKAGAALGVLSGAAAAAAVAGVVAVGAGVAQGVKDAGDYETLANKTAAALESTGNAARQSVGAIQDRASMLESMSGVDETAIINGQNLLLTFTNIKDGLEEGTDVFGQATAAALDMSVAMGTDMQSSVIQLGKALNDPLKGITALTRAGVSFTAQQKEQIASLVKHGDTLGAQRIILAELNKEFGGAAQAAGAGFEGSMARAKDAVSDAFRAVGTELLPVLTKLADWFAREGMPRIVAFAQDAWPKVQAAFALVSDVITNRVMPVVGKVVSFLMDTVVPAVRDYLGKALDGLRGAWALVSDAIEDHRPQLEAVGKLLVTVAGWVMENVVPVLGTILRETFRTLGATISIVINIISFLVDAFQTLGKWGTWLWNNALAPAIRFILNGFASLTSAIAAVLDALGNIPGFEWAKSAADKMHSAADKARDLATSIHAIPPDVPIAVRFDASYTQAFATAMNALNSSRKLAAPGYNAAGTASWRGGLTWVGEQGPELVSLPAGTRIWSNAQSVAMAAGGSGVRGGDGAALQPIVVQLDGRTILEATVKANRQAGYVLTARA